MAGALTAPSIASPGATPYDASEDSTYAASNAGPSAGNEFQGGASPDATMGVLSMLNAVGGYDPMQYGIGMGPGALTAQDLEPSPEVQNIFQTGSQLGRGALGTFQGVQGQIDTGAAGKMAAIDRAMQIIAGAQSGNTVNLPLLAAAAGMAKPTYGGIGAAIGNAASAAVPAIAQQREIERQTAGELAQLGVEGATVPLETAEEKEKVLMDQLRASGQFTETGARLYGTELLAKMREQYGRDISQSRVDVAQINKNAKLAAASISGATKQSTDALNYLARMNGNRFQYAPGTQKDQYGNVVTGLVQTDRTGGDPPRFLPGMVYAGKGAAGGKPSVFEERRQAYLAVHPDDSIGALDYASGHAQMTDQEINKSALTLAEKDLSAQWMNPPSDKDAFLKQRAAEYAQAIRGGFGGANAASPAPNAAPAPGGAAPAQGTVAPAGLTQDEAFAQARAAIKAGAPPDAVRERLQKMFPHADTSGL